MTSAPRLQRICSAQIRLGARPWVEALRNAALDKISKGGGVIASFTAVSANGKSFTAEINADAIVVADVTQAALDEADGLGTGGSGFTSPDFSA